MAKELPKFKPKRSSFDLLQEVFDQNGDAFDVIMDVLTKLNNDPKMREKNPHFDPLIKAARGILKSNKKLIELMQLERRGE